MANALEAASLVMIPSGYEDGTLGSLKPTDGSGDFTFSRGSNLSATRVGPNGYIEKGYENRLLQSNQFDTNWVLQGGATLGSRVADPNGGNDAWEINFTTNTSSRIEQQISVTNRGVYTFSVYARVPSGTQTLKIFTTISGGGSAKTLTTEWQRFELFGVSNGYTIAFPQLRNDTGIAYTAHIYAAQYNEGLVAYPYIETTTAPVAGGILEDMPRLNGSCPALLLEPQRTNLVPHSEYFSSWQPVGSPIITENTTETLSPEGKYNATKIVGDGDNGIYKATLSNAGGNNVKSIYIKGINGGETCALRDPNQTNVVTTCNITTEWQRFECVDNQTSSMGIWLDNIPASGIYIWGAQLEQDATYPTSYIPTYGVSQTRLAESGNVAQINNYIVDITGDFTFYIDNTDSLLKGNELYYYFIELYWSAIVSIRYYSTNNGSWYFKPDNDYTGFNNSVGKQIIKYENGIFYHFLNGFKAIQTRTMATSGSLQEIRLLTNSVGKAGYLNIKEMLLFPTALSDDECIALTTI